MSMVTNPSKVIRLAFILFVLITLPFSTIVLAQKKKAPAPSKTATVQKKKKATARKPQKSKARSTTARRSQTSRRGTRTARSTPNRKAIAREQAVALRSLQRRLGRKPTARERAAEMRRVQARHGAAARRAEAARRAAIARQRALDEAIRNEVQGLIARDNTAGEDLEVRQIAVRALGHRAGTVVVMDPISGRIYTIVNQEWAVRRGFKPCSTIKLVTGLAGLAEKMIDPISFHAVSERYNIDLTDALAYSNNTFFQHIGGQVGYEGILKYARELGLGERTGINAPFEYPGRLPAEKTGFALNRMCSHGDDFEVTALQLATMVSAMANGGKLLVPYIPANASVNEQKAKVRRELSIEKENWRRMVPGMVGAVNYGSGKRAYDPLQTVAGKTGTCIGQGGWVGLFASYAPLTSPRLAVVVIGKGPDARRQVASAVAGQIYRDLNGRFGTPVNLQIAKTPADDEDSRATELDEEEQEAREAEMAEAAALGESEEVEAPAGARSTDPVTPRNTVKRVLMPVERRNPEAQKTEAQKSNGAPKTAPENNSQAERPRRAQPQP